MTDQTLNPAPAWGHTNALVDIGPASVQPSTTAQALDRLLILDVVSRYAWSYDERFLDSLRSVFTDDAVWEGSVAGTFAIDPIKGGDAIVSWLQGHMEAQTDQRRHNATNPLFTAQTDDAATVNTFLLITSCKNGVTSHVTSGFYVIDLVKADGGWKISRMFGAFDNAF